MYGMENYPIRFHVQSKNSYRAECRGDTRELKVGCPTITRWTAGKCGINRIYLALVNSLQFKAEYRCEIITVSNSGW